MINTTITKLQDIVDKLKESIHLDIEDVKKAKHESLVNRNEVKIVLMDDLANEKKILNEELSKAYKNGVDISIYKQNIDSLESNLRELFELNGKLASIVLPVKEMYKDIIDDITKKNGGSLVEVMA